MVREWKEMKDKPNNLKYKTSKNHPDFIPIVNDVKIDEPSKIELKVNNSGLSKWQLKLRNKN